MPSHHHRAGGLRQTNKKNKRSKASKRSLIRASTGKVLGVKGSGSAVATQSKADRRNHQKQRRDAKRQEMTKKRLGMDAGSFAQPRVVGIVSLGSNSDLEDSLRDFIIQGADEVVRPHNHNSEASVSCRFQVHKKDGNLTVLTSSAFLNDTSCTDDNAMIAALDLARVCDILLIVVDGDAPVLESQITEINLGADDRSSHTGKSTLGRNWDHLISERGDRILTALKGQGLPTPLTILAQTEKDELDGDDHMTTQSTKSLRRSTLKRRLEMRKYVHRFATTEFGTELNKVVEVDLTVVENDDMEEDFARQKSLLSASLVRVLCTMSCSPPKWVANSFRPYLISDTYHFNEEAHELHLTGYVRGSAPFNCNSLVHVPNVGTFVCKSVAKAREPLRSNHKALADDPSKEIVFSDPDRQESLNMFASPNALDGEQNLVGFDDVEDDATFDKNNDKLARPAGWSDYQSAWLDAVGEVDDVGEVVEDGDAVDHGELAAELNRKDNSTVARSTGAENDMDIDDANDVTAEEKRTLMEQRQKEQNDHLDFPDEVQVDEGMNARDRFARYRSLKSFRKSIWDPKESLPESYASIYNFSSFKTTQKSIMNELKFVVAAAERAGGNFWGKSPPSTDGDENDEVMVDVNANIDKEEEQGDDDDLLLACVPAGAYVTLTLRDVSVDHMKHISIKSLLAAVTLLPHENKVSVLNMGLSQTSSCVSTEERPVKSKDVLTIRCGWRTWQARPVFSQNNLNCDKHKFERYMPRNGCFFAASCFGPVTYTPSPVLVMREVSLPDALDNGNSSHQRQQGIELVALGGTIGADADRIVMKRVVLTGYPVRVHKRYATVKYMFYNPDDVKWFKPAGLYTKHGLQGNIIDSIGEHGTMKCLFNANIKQHDTVCLPLYKRIYPKHVLAGQDRSCNKSLKETNVLIVR